MHVRTAPEHAYALNMVCACTTAGVNACTIAGVHACSIAVVRTARTIAAELACNMLMISMYQSYKPCKHALTCSTQLYYDYSTFGACMYMPIVHAFTAAMHHAFTIALVHR